MPFADAADEALPLKINEQWLFHGSCRGALASICARGFDARLAHPDRRFGQAQLFVLFTNVAAS